MTHEYFLSKTFEEKKEIKMENYHNGGGQRDTDFKKLAQTIGTNIQKIFQNVSSMSRMINQIGSPQDNQQLQNQL